LDQFGQASRAVPRLLSKNKEGLIMKAESRKQIETTERTITVKLPKRFDSYLEGLARALNRSVESILLEQLYSNLENFFEGGFAECWTNKILDDEDGSRKNLERQVSQVADTVLKTRTKQPPIVAL
jgi:hypothetical protein